MGAADKVRGEGVVLRRFHTEDMDDLVAGCNDPLTQRFLPLLPSPYTPSDAMQWINERSVEAFAEGGGAWAFADPTTDRLLGGGGFGRVHAGAAHIGYWVAPWARGRGVATAATKAMTTLAITQGIQRLSLRTQPANSASQRVAIAAGFSREGVERGGGQNRDGGRHDLIVWARLATDPDGPARRLLPDLPGRTGDRAGELSDGVVALRPLDHADVEDTHALRNLPDVLATSVSPQPPSRENIARVCAESQAGWLAGHRADLTIRDAATGAFAGEIGLYYFESGTQQAMIGYSMVPKWRGRGYASRAARLVAHWAFEQGIARVIAGTAPNNIGSQRVLERAGFVREGYQRSRLPAKNGTRIDDILWAKLPDASPQRP